MTTTPPPAIVQRLWNYCTHLRDDGMSYGDYVEQLTYLLFLKMAHERTQPPYSQPSRIPAGCAGPASWPATAGSSKSTNSPSSRPSAPSPACSA